MIDTNKKNQNLDFFPKTDFEDVKNQEWDFFSKAYTIIGISVPLNSIKIEQMTVKRNEDYSITIECLSSIDKNQNIDEFIKSMQNPISISFTHPIIKEEFKIENGYIKKYHTQFKDDLKNKLLFFEIYNCTITITSPNNLKINRLIQWFLNGPNQNFVFFRSTERNFIEKYERKRKNDFDNPLNIDIIKSVISQDYFLFNYPKLAAFNTVGLPIFKLLVKVSPKIFVFSACLLTTFQPGSRMFICDYHF